MIFADTILPWARTNSGLISVAGALIVFFSWVVTNTLVQRYSRMKVATESAQATFRLYTTLHEQRNQLNSIAMEVIQRSEAGLNASQVSPGNTLIDQARKDYSLTRLSAHQVRELMDFTTETHALSRAVGKSSATSATVEALLSEVGELHGGLLDYERDAETALNNSGQQPEKCIQAVHAYSEHFRLKALPRVPDLYQRIVAASNIRRDEASRYLANAKEQAGISGRISIFLYIIGSCLALTGQAIEKTKPKESTTKTLQVSEDSKEPTKTRLDNMLPAPSQNDPVDSKP